MQFQKLPSYLVTLAGVVILGAVSFSANQPTQAFTAKSTVQVPPKKSLASQDRQLAIAPLSNSSILVAQISPVGGIAVILVMCGIVIGVILVPGIVQVGQDEIGIVRKNFGRPTTRLIALKKNEIGWQAKTLDPGLHWYFPWLFDIQKKNAIYIAPDKIGIVEAKDGDPVSPGQNFGKVVECNNFQNAQAFFENKGQRGKQRGILNTGIYRINTELFDVEIKDVIRIHADQVGIVEAKDGDPVSPGQNFGKVVECNDFQDAQAFFDNGGQRGEQLAILTTGTYQINTELFKIQRDSLIRIEADQVGIVEAKDGDPVSPGQNFGKVVECNDFQNAQAFFENKGQRGKQRGILNTGIYRINTKLFVVKVENVIRIHADQVGIVEAKDGATPPPGQNFGKVVECNDFQDAQAFFDNGGQRGKQLAILTTGTYQINTELFKIQRDSLIRIEAGEIGIIEAKDGALLP
ncbi:hypothetical protein LC653_34025, partial [Nostoc sp. CHAB 5784]|nr:hypothetical protein [Nostoc mirabile CHAB5784]